MLRPALASRLALAVALSAAACGRTPPWLPCRAAADDEVPVVSCADASCQDAPTTQLQPRSATALLVLDRSRSMAELLLGTAAGLELALACEG